MAVVWNDVGARVGYMHGVPDDGNHVLGLCRGVWRKLLDRMDGPLI